VRDASIVGSIGGAPPQGNASKAWPEKNSLKTVYIWVILWHVSTSPKTTDAGCRRLRGHHCFLTCNQNEQRMTNNESPTPRPRTREHLMPEEVAKFLAAAKDKSLSRNPERDYA